MQPDTECRSMSDWPWASQMGELGANLVSAFAPADGAFVAVGDQLSDAVGIFARLGQLFASLQATLDDPELGQAARSLSGVGHDIRELAAALCEEEAALDSLRALNGHLGRHIDVIRRTIRAISMLAINAHISASDVNVEGEDIASFALRFKQLAASARATVAASAAHSQRLAQALEAAQARQARFMLDHHQALATVAAKIEAGVEAMDAGRAGAAEASRAIGAGSQQISADIGAVVMALQISDITRQRLDHVAEALATAAEGLRQDILAPGSQPQWSAGLGREQLQIVSAGVCRLGEAQMAGAVGDLDREVERAAASLRRLAAEAEDLVALGARGYGTGGAGFASFLAALRAELGDAATLFRLCQGHRAEVDAGMAVAVAALHDLLEQLADVKRIEEDIRLVSLNTAFLCQRIGGRGRVLATIAQELRGRAARLLDDVQSLSGVANEIGAVARTFEQARQVRGAAKIAAMEEAIAAALEPFSRAAADLGAALARLEPEGRAVGRTLRASVATLARLDDVARTLHGVHRRLSRIALHGPAGPGDEALRRERLRLFPVGYTMASERAIHAAVCGLETVADAPDAADCAGLDALF